MTSASLNEGQPCFSDSCTKSAQLLRMVRGPMSSRTAKPVMHFGSCATKSSRIHRRANHAGQTQQHVRREENKNSEVPAHRGLEQRLARDRVVEDGGARLYLCFSALFLEKGSCLPVPSALGPMPVVATNPVRLHMPHLCRIQIATRACSLPVLLLMPPLRVATNKHFARQRMHAHRAVLHGARACAAAMPVSRDQHRAAATGKRWTPHFPVTYRFPVAAPSQRLLHRTLCLFVDLAVFERLGLCADAEAARTKGAQALHKTLVCEGGLMVLSDWVADAEWAHARHVPCARFRIMSSPACALIPSGALAPCLRFCSCWTK